ncbi:flagellar FliJ family protein [Carboxydochorda subterranea]|uniref:Flagellar FliJ protein n=1 Tax=Carboxydichorda subterranea TaxID=3109565 RepID=A0ABZ1C0T5_9FIRM|nr:flagellar FliJ family protein [Limnochorda sp. L945t]WRP18450.1 flagellar FliJ family protein [Limnochorda sp. L945t]
MKRFRFRMERILRLRRQSLDVERTKMAEALRLEQAAQQAYAAGEERRVRYLAALSESVAASAPGSGVEGAVLAERLGVLAELSRRRAYWDVQRVEARRQVEKQRAMVVEAHRAVRVLELLRDRRRAEYLRQLERDEQALLDEAGSQGFVRRRGNGYGR